MSTQPTQPLIIHGGWDTPPSEPIPWGAYSLKQQAPQIAGINGYVSQAVRTGVKPNGLLNLSLRDDWTSQDFLRMESGTHYTWLRWMSTPSSYFILDNFGWNKMASKLQLIYEAATARGSTLLIDLEHFVPKSGVKPTPLFHGRMEQHNSACATVYQHGQDLYQRGIRHLAFPRILSYLIDQVPYYNGGWFTKPGKPLPEHTYGILHAFLSGMLDAGIIITDFCATRAAITPQEVLDQYLSIRNRLPLILGRDYSRLKLGGWFYLDHLVNPDLSPSIHLPSLLSAYYQFCEPSTSLVIYGEKGRFLEPNPSLHAPPEGEYFKWLDQLPGVSSALLRVKDPVRYALNLTEVEHNIIPDDAWVSAWTGDITPKFVTDLLTIEGAGDGYYIQYIPVIAGRSYAVQGTIRSSASAWITIRWEKGPKPRIRVGDRTHSRRLYPLSTNPTTSAIVTAPPDCNIMVVALQTDHSKPEDQTTFSSIKVAQGTYL